MDLSCNGDKRASMTPSHFRSKTTMHVKSIWAESRIPVSHWKGSATVLEWLGEVMYLVWLRGRRRLRRGTRVLDSEPLNTRGSSWGGIISALAQTPWAPWKKRIIRHAPRGGLAWRVGEILGVRGRGSCLWAGLGRRHSTIG